MIKSCIPNSSSGSSSYSCEMLSSSARKWTTQHVSIKQKTGRSTEDKTSIKNTYKKTCEKEQKKQV